MVRLYIQDRQTKGVFSEEDFNWLREDVYPLIKKDYENFWMNPQTRFDAATGLNHHYDDLNEARPERHSTDNEEALGKTYRDVRAAAESGEDFTDACEGEETRCAGVLLNSVLYQVEENLSRFAKMIGKMEDAGTFKKAAQKRREAIDKYLWDKNTNTFRNYLFDEGRRSSVLSADTFIPLYVGAVTQKRAKKLMKNLERLERKGGLLASDHVSGKQWDGPFGWAPQHYFAISGMKKYGFKKEARRLAKKWVKTVDRIYEDHGKIIEKVDVTTGNVPTEDGEKYPTQEGFLWTNGVYVWCLHHILKIPFSLSLN
jgi:alpha,alpha-trehalase